MGYLRARYRNIAGLRRIKSYGWGHAKRFPRLIYRVGTDRAFCSCDMCAWTKRKKSGIRALTYSEARLPSISEILKIGD